MRTRRLEQPAKSLLIGDIVSYVCQRKQIVAEIKIIKLFSPRIDWSRPGCMVYTSY